MLCAQRWWRLSYPLLRAQPSKHFRRHFTFLRASPPPKPSHSMGKKANSQSASGPDHPKDEEYLKTVIEKRIKLFQYIKELQNSRIRTLPGAGDLIRITMPDGNVMEGKRYETSPLLIAKQISKILASNALIAKVNGVLWDMARPIEEDCDLKLFTFETNEGRDTFCHSRAHILGEAIEQEYGCKLCIGPCTTRGEIMESSSKEVSSSTAKQSIRLENLEVLKEQTKKEIERILNEMDVLQQLIKLNEQKLDLEIQILIRFQELAASTTKKKEDDAPPLTMKGPGEDKDDAV